MSPGPGANYPIGEPHIWPGLIKGCSHKRVVNVSQTIERHDDICRDCGVSIMYVRHHRPGGQFFKAKVDWPRTEKRWEANEEYAGVSLRTERYCNMAFRAFLLIIVCSALSLAVFYPLFKYTGISL